MPDYLVVRTASMEVVVTATSSIEAMNTALKWGAFDGMDWNELDWDAELLASNDDENSEESDGEHKDQT